VSSNVRRQKDIMTVKRMDNVGIVVEDIDAAIEFFTELGLHLEGRAPVEGDWAGPEGILIGLAQQLGQQTSRENPIGPNR
jgi:catechol 2,3-dioxygenase-like lactoylglutathione lyase family enzyme